MPPPLLALHAPARRRCNGSSGTRSRRDARPSAETPYPFRTFRPHRFTTLAFATRSAADRVTATAAVPNATRAARLFSRSLWAVAYVTAGGTIVDGFQGRPGRPVRGGTPTCPRTYGPSYTGCSSEVIGRITRLPVRRRKSRTGARAASATRPPRTCSAGRSPMISESQHLQWRNAPPAIRERTKCGIGTPTLALMQPVGASPASTNAPTIPAKMHPIGNGLTLRFSTG